MANRAHDTFIEGGGDVNLNVHTPTGQFNGSGWLAVAGTINVIAATDLVQDASASAGNRYLMTRDLGSDVVNLQADFTTGTSGFLAPGFIARRNSAGAGVGGTNWEGGWEADGGKYRVEDGTAATELVEAWPGGTVTLRLEMRAGVARLYSNGVLKITHTSTLGFGMGGHYCGIRLLNFTSGATGQLSCDNYTSESAVVPLAGSQQRPKQFAPSRLFPARRSSSRPPKDLLSVPAAETATQQQWMFMGMGA